MATEILARHDDRRDNQTKKKKWRKPGFHTIGREELKKYILAAANSGLCFGKVGR